MRRGGRKSQIGRALVVCQISVRLMHYLWLVADHWHNAASEAVAHTHFAFVDAPELPCPGGLRRDAHTRSD